MLSLNGCNRFCKDQTQINTPYKRHPMDKRLLEILVCPLCKSPVHLDCAKQELICKADRLAYPIRNDIPVMLVDEARSLEADELA